MIPLIERLKLILADILAIASETITDDATQESEITLSMTVAELAAMIESKL